MRFADLHTHTKLCNHASGEPEEYLDAAIRAGLGFLGVSDHFPAPDGYDQSNRMLMLEYAQYRSILAGLKQRAEGTGLEVLYGTEFDYVPGRMREVYDALSREEFDYTIGSIHFVDAFAFDHPDYQDRWDDLGVDSVWNRYLELLCEFLNGYRFNIIGHIDLPKKFGHRHSDNRDYRQKITSVLELAAARGVAMELNTAGFRKPVNELYPQFEVLQLAFEHGVPITLGSDAHAPNEVGFGFQRAVELAKAAGYRSALAFRSRNAFELPFD